MSPPCPDILEKARTHFQEVFGNQTAEKALICGSGWSAVTQDVTVITSLAFDRIPGLGSPGVAGHKGEVALCDLNGSRVLIFKGRRHFYEGEGWTPVAIPVYLCVKSGVKELLLTNSAGAVNPEFDVGDLMVIQDHFNAIGDNPLVGAHQDIWGPRFPDLTHTYGEPGQRRLFAAGEKAGIPLRKGVYFATRGPVYETPAEVRAWKHLGADAVGMSTVPEAILAHAAGIRVSGVSCMTNFAAGISPHPLTHREVTETTSRNMPRMQALLKNWICPPL